MTMANPTRNGSDPMIKPAAIMAAQQAIGTGLIATTFRDVATAAAALT